jgi:hypothetical protein
MVEKFNREFLRESIIQACEDIKNGVDTIVSDVDSLNYLTISICVEDNVQFPYISIDKDYKKFVTVTDKITEKIQEAVMNG